MNYLELLAGDPQAFINQAWGRHPLIHQADPGTLQHIFGIDHADELLTTSALRTPQVRLARDGKVLDQASFTKKPTIAGQPMTGLLDAAKVLALFDAGATIVFQGLQRYWEPLRQLVRGLEADLGHPCQANAYLTPPGSQGFALHTDAHDVFTFQTFGSKEWEIHEDGVPRQVQMRPGTSMYLPAGTPHLARTGAGVASLHVTVGIQQVEWAEVVRDVVNRTINDSDRLARPLPAAMYADPAALAEQIRARLGELADELATVDTAAVVERMQRQFETGRQPLLAGALHDLLALRELTATSRLRRRTGTTCTIRTRGDRIELLLGDRELSMPARVEPAIRAVLDAEEFTPADLSQLNAEGALVLCRRLVREGLLEVVG